LNFGRPRSKLFFLALAPNLKLPGPLRAETTLAKLHAFMRSLGTAASGPGRVYLTGGASALLYEWRPTTIDIDIKGVPEPPGFFEAIVQIKEQLDVNVELAAPDQFIPELPSWQQRSIFIGKFGQVDFFHYDFYSQALAKLERGHTRDKSDVIAMLALGLIRVERLLELFEEIEPKLIRYPAITPSAFRTEVTAFCNTHSNPT